MEKKLRKTQHDFLLYFVSLHMLFIYSLICMSIRSQWQLLRTRNKPVQTIHWYLTMHGRAIACAYYCVTRAISRAGGLIHLISGGNLLGNSDEWYYYIMFSRFNIFIIINVDFMTCMNEVNDWWLCWRANVKINALVLRFFHITNALTHRVRALVRWKKIARRVHWFLTFELQQIHIQSLTSN